MYLACNNYYCDTLMVIFFLYFWHTSTNWNVLWDLAVPSSQFMHLLNYLYHYGHMDTYGYWYYSTSIIYFVVHIWPLEAGSCYSCVLSTCPKTFESFLLKMLQTHFYMFPSIAPGSNNFPGIPGFFYWRIGFRYQDLGTRCV